MKKKGILMMVALVAALTLGVSMPAFAATDTDVPVVSKTLKVNNGSSVTETFNFTATPVALSTGNGSEKTYTDGPEATIESIALSATNADATDYGAIKFGGKEDVSQFTHAGIYAWTIAETAGSTEGMQYDSQKYTLIATVKNGTSGLEFGSFVVVKGETSTITNDASNKVDDPAFTNKYTEEAKDLTITKTVKGDLGDKTKLFDFTVTFKAADSMVLPAGKTAEQILDAITYSTAGTVSNISVATASSGTKVVTFKAADAGYIDFDNVLAGITYDITEAATDSYDQSWAATANGVDTTAQSDILIGENTNAGTMTNTYKDVTPTGLVLNNLPFVLMVVVLLAGLLGYGALKRKLEA